MQYGPMTEEEAMNEEQKKKEAIRSYLTTKYNAPIEDEPMPDNKGGRILGDLVTNLGSAFEDFGRAGSVARGGARNDGSFYSAVNKQIGSGFDREEKKVKDANAQKRLALDDAFKGDSRARQQQEWSDSDAAIDVERDPNSPQSEMARQLAKRMMPTKNFDGMSASQLKNALPSLEKLYRIDEEAKALVQSQQDAQRRQQDADFYRQEALRDRREKEDYKREQDELARAEKLRLEDEKKAKEIESLTVPGFGIANNADDAKKIKEGIENRQSFNSKIREMIQLREKHDGGALFNREDIARGKQLSKDALLAYKNMAKLGVLSQADQDIVEAIIPSDPLEFNSPLAAIQGQDPTLSRLKKFNADVERDFQTTLDTRLKREGRVEQKQDKKMSEEDALALDWANSNPNDPRSVEIKRRLGK